MILLVRVLDYIDGVYFVAVVDGKQKTLWPVGTRSSSGNPSYITK